jgi:hypothetical protein
MLVIHIPYPWDLRPRLHAGAASRLLRCTRLSPDALGIPIAFSINAIVELV